MLLVAMGDLTLSPVKSSTESVGAVFEKAYKYLRSVIPLINKLLRSKLGYQNIAMRIYPKSCAKRHMETVPRLRPRYGETLLAGPNESYLIGRVRSEALKPAFSVIIKTLHPLLAQDLGLSQRRHPRMS
jgi:hypothetical protein